MSQLSIAGIGQGILQFMSNIIGGAQASSQTQTTTPATASAMLSGHKHGGMFRKIEDAVTNALQSTPASGASSDPNVTIQSAIAQLLAGNGADSDGNTDATGQTDDSTSYQNFMQLLASKGVTPEQFGQDLLAAIQQTQGGAAAPTGTLVNTVA